MNIRWYQVAREWSVTKRCCKQLLKINIVAGKSLVLLLSMVKSDCFDYYVLNALMSHFLFCFMIMSNNLVFGFVSTSVTDEIKCSLRIGLENFQVSFLLLANHDLYRFEKIFINQ